MSSKLTGIEATIPVGNYANIKAMIEGADEVESLNYLSKIAEMVGNDEYADTVRQTGDGSQEATKYKTLKYNDNTVLFDEINHKYVCGDKVMMSGSEFAGLMTEEFDKERLSALVADKSGLTKEQVLNLWENKGNVATSFGTAVHTGIENYIRYANFSKKLGGKEKVLSSVPFVNDLIHSAMDALDEYYKEPILSSKRYTLIPEMFVVEDNLCGFIDLAVFDKENKTVDIWDWKNVEDMFKKIKWAIKTDQEPVLLSKYKYQLSFYAHIMSNKYKVRSINIAHVKENKTVVHKSKPLDISKILKEISDGNSKS